MRFGTDGSFMMLRSAEPEPGLLTLLERSWERSMLGILEVDCTSVVKQSDSVV